MKHSAVSLSEAARDDVDRIFDYILTISGSAEVAGSYIGRLIDFCDDIGWVPGGGLRVYWKGRILRRRMFERSIFIFYELKNNRIRIIRVISARRKEATSV